MAKSANIFSKSYFKIFIILLLLCFFIILFLNASKKVTVNSTVSAPTAIPSQSVSTVPTIESVSPTLASNIAGSGEHCGGFIRNAKQCASGYHCKLGHIPDTGGVCVKD